MKKIVTDINKITIAFIYQYLFIVYSFYKIMINR